jgi:hypothetical protein
LIERYTVSKMEYTLEESQNMFNKNLFLVVIFLFLGIYVFVHGETSVSTTEEKDSMKRAKTSGKGNIMQEKIPFASHIEYFAYNDIPFR